VKKEVAAATAEDKMNIYTYSPKETTSGRTLDVDWNIKDLNSGRFQMDHNKDNS
jgi:hypothetical protein